MIEGAWKCLNSVNVSLHKSIKDIYHTTKFVGRLPVLHVQKGHPGDTRPSFF